MEYQRCSNVTRYEQHLVRNMDSNSGSGYCDHCRLPFFFKQITAQGQASFNILSNSTYTYIVHEQKEPFFR